MLSLDNWKWEIFQKHSHLPRNPRKTWCLESLYSPYTNNWTDCYTSSEDTIPIHCPIVIGYTRSSDQVRFQGLVACSKLGPVYRWVLPEVFFLLLEVSLNRVVILRSILSRYPINSCPWVCLDHMDTNNVGTCSSESTCFYAFGSIPSQCVARILQIKTSNSVVNPLVSLGWVVLASVKKKIPF